MVRSPEKPGLAVQGFSKKKKKNSNTFSSLPKKQNLRKIVTIIVVNQNLTLSKQSFTIKKS